MQIKEDLLEIGDKIRITIKENSEKVEYSSQILEKISSTKFVISGPISKNTLIPIHINSNIEISYYKKGKGRFKLNATVINRMIENFYKLEIERHDNVTKIQERDYYRLPTNINILKKHNYAEKDIEEKCVIKDLSGGGMKVLCNYEHQMGELVKCIFLDEVDNVISGKITRIIKSDNSNYKFEIGVEFSEIENNKREKIIRYIFEQQRKFKKRI